MNPLPSLVTQQSTHLNTYTRYPYTTNFMSRLAQWGVYMAQEKKGVKKPMKSASSAAGGKLKVEGEEERLEGEEEREIRSVKS